MLLFISLFFCHPLHVTITSVDINHAQGEISVSHKFFTDDFSLLFFHLYEVNIIPEDNVAFTEKELGTIEGYMSEAFVLRPDQDSIVTFEYTGKDQNEDSVWLYFKGELPEGGCSNFILTNHIMFDLYFDQTNLVIVASEDDEKGLTFDWENRIFNVELGMRNRELGNGN
ncbi:MAG: hypothetical protein JXA61_04715 [Bacteroidales bacterium]|nr:hypothetical protein [Bacteroidales bacterium]